MTVGRTEPRLWTKPLRELTPETSLGFEVVEFARVFLGVELYPWQEWLLVHALELRPDGQYRFRRVIVLVARQNGKTTLASVLAAWWLFVDSARHTDRVPPVEFKIVGTAQNLDIARGPWLSVRRWCNPDPRDAEEAALVIPELQAVTQRVIDTNGKESIIAASLAHYETRAVKSSRGKPAARVLMDELREQQTWAGWNAVSQTAKAFWCGQVWGISNAGDAGSVVLKAQREAALELIGDWAEHVEAGLVSAEEYANNPLKDTSIGLFEWSAPDGCDKDDPEAILQANPSIGYGNITVAACISDARSMPDASYRTEVLCQWVEARVDSYIDVRALDETVVPVSDIRVEPGTRTVWAVDTSHDRRTSYVAAATHTAEGVPLVTIRTQRAGMLWVVDYLIDLAEASGYREVCLQTRGAPSREFAEPLARAGLVVHAIDGGDFATACGRYRDAIHDHRLITVDQPPVRLAVDGGIAVKYAESDALSRHRSMTDVSPAIAEALALYGLEVVEPPIPARVSAYEAAGLMTV